jgi:acetate kinase
MVSLSSITIIASGSCSIKFSLYALGEAERPALKGKSERIGVCPGFFQAEDCEGNHVTVQKFDLLGSESALRILSYWQQGHGVGKDPQAMGHLLAHGGTTHVKTQPGQASFRRRVKTSESSGPDHLPDEMKGLEPAHPFLPDVPQIACLNTARYRRMPDVAIRYALPEFLIWEGLQRCWSVIRDSVSSVRSLGLLLGLFAREQVGALVTSWLFIRSGLGSDARRDVRAAHI